jgi:hypothetical protein
MAGTADPTGEFAEPNDRANVYVSAPAATQSPASPERRGVLMQPWELGSLPDALLPMLRQVDEIWVCIRSFREHYLDAGAPPDRVLSFLWVSILRCSVRDKSPCRCRLHHRDPVFHAKTQSENQETQRRPEGTYGNLKHDSQFFAVFASSLRLCEKSS